ncbi:galactosylgalactosylxylosylprotein 3-beta-glucuronosyltransferase P [Sitodiplosis mosellana]|uniref:galactosylgalactosylxylosylprotein 3-beta-glucuronosyltransferase P n=1 Tax=Sitodiplosis mosellana TaxID=263140 RepID=UPI002443A658|nr:galactosylgalactosylxylosylprotein 3-beta-glucuronosyltransferase P [Sitodiplosis mosellana]
MNIISSSVCTMKTTTKMYLSVILSTLCIVFYQYQLSKANFVTLQRGDVFGGNNNIVTSDSRNINSIEVKESTKTPSLPPLYVITPTYRRPEQLAEITRLGYTLKHVPNIFWLVIEDATVATPLVTRQLKRIGVPFEHLVAPMPDRFKKRVVKPRGVSNRNRGLAWIRKNASDGVFYFADDDNTYDLEIFDQMRYTKKVSMWPVGLVTKYGLSSPIVRNGTIFGFYDGWIGGRKYPVDMAGFAVNVKFFQSRPKAIMPYHAGYEEDKFLRSLAPLNITEIELLASNCTEILTWHTQTKKNPVASPLDMHKYNGTNLVNLHKLIV